MLPRTHGLQESVLCDGRIRPYVRAGAAFTIIELVVIIAIIAVLIALLLPAMAGARESALRTKSTVNVRSIHMALTTFGQQNNGYYPGVDRFGRVIDPLADFSGGHQPRVRFAILLDHDLVDGEVLISPFDQQRVRATSGPLVPENYSYALLTLMDGGGNEAPTRLGEWRGTGNADAATVSDRLLEGTYGDPTTYKSIVTRKRGEWFGSIAWNDEHVTFEPSALLAKTRYLDWPHNRDDDLFDQRITGNQDANMTYIDSSDGDGTQ